MIYSLNIGGVKRLLTLSNKPTDEEKKTASAEASAQRKEQQKLKFKDVPPDIQQPSVRPSEEHEYER
jgi:hypothetical protein